MYSSKTEIFSSDSVARISFGSNRHIHHRKSDNKISINGEAFHLDEKDGELEEYISVFLLDRGTKTIENKLKEIKDEFASNYGVSFWSKDRFILLDVGRVIKKVKEIEKTDLVFKHHPSIVKKNSSHSGILNTRPGNNSDKEKAICNVIAGNYLSVHKAKNGKNIQDS